MTVGVRVRERRERFGKQRFGAIEAVDEGILAAAI